MKCVWTMLLCDPVMQIFVPSSLPSIISSYLKKYVEMGHCYNHILVVKCHIKMWCIRWYTHLSSVVECLIKIFMMVGSEIKYIADHSSLQCHNLILHFILAKRSILHCSNEVPQWQARYATWRNEARRKWQVNKCMPTGTSNDCSNKCK